MPLAKEADDPTRDGADDGSASETPWGQAQTAWPWQKISLIVEVPRDHARDMLDVATHAPTRHLVMLQRAFASAASSSDPSIWSTRGLC